MDLATCIVIVLLVTLERPCWRVSQ